MHLEKKMKDEIFGDFAGKHEWTICNIGFKQRKENYIHRSALKMKLEIK